MRFQYLLSLNYGIHLILKLHKAIWHNVISKFILIGIYFFLKELVESL